MWPHHRYVRVYDIRVRWDLDRDLPGYTPRFNIAPETSPNIPVIVRHQGVNECRLMQRGLIPYWATDPSIGSRIINARAETLTELPSLKHLVDRRRWIIPADGFYEWRKEAKRKVPMWVHLKSKEPFGLAGLWDVWRKPDGKRVESFTIITTEPNELIQPIHYRMPVMLRQEDEEQWLDVSRTPFAKAESLLKPLPAELMDAHDVSQSSTQLNTTARSASNLFQMTKCQAPGSCPCCDEDLLIAPSLHALIENLPLAASASEGSLALALVQVAVTIFVKLTLGGIAQS